MEEIKIDMTVPHEYHRLLMKYADVYGMSVEEYTRSILKDHVEYVVAREMVAEKGVGRTDEHNRMKQGDNDETERNRN